MSSAPDIASVDDPGPTGELEVWRDLKLRLKIMCILGFHVLTWAGFFAIAASVDFAIDHWIFTPLATHGWHDHVLTLMRVLVALALLFSVGVYVVEDSIVMVHQARDRIRRHKAGR